MSYFTQTLYKAGEGKLGTDESGFFNILTLRTYAHLRFVFDEYMKRHQSSIEGAIKSEFGGITQTALLEFGKYSVRSHFGTANFLLNIHNRHHIARLPGELCDVYC